MHTLLKLAPELARRHKITQKEAQALIGTFRDLMVESLTNGDDLMIGDLGRLVLKQRKARMGRNPQNGQPVEIKAMTTVTFKPSSVLLDKLNG